MKIAIYTVFSISFLVVMAFLLCVLANGVVAKYDQFCALVWALVALGMGMFFLTVRAALKAGQIAKGTK